MMLHGGLLTGVYCSVHSTDLILCWDIATEWTLHDG